MPSLSPTNPSASGGGAIANIADDTNTTINQAAWTVELKVTSSQFTGNTANVSGSAIFNSSSDNRYKAVLYVANSTFTSNQAYSCAPTSSGGALEVENATVTITDSTLSSNLVGKNASPTAGCSGNTHAWGGGIYANSNQQQFGALDVSLTDVYFSANDASASGLVDDIGGGILTQSVGTLQIIQSTFANNLAYAGGGIESQVGVTTINNSTFYQNGETAQGNKEPTSVSGIVVNQAGNVQISYTTIASNHGYGLWLANGTGTIAASILVSNDATTNNTPDNCRIDAGSSLSDGPNGSYNLSDDAPISNNTCHFTGQTDYPGTPVGFSTFARSIGKTALVLSLPAGSPAIDKIPPGNPNGVSCGSGVGAADERGLARPVVGNAAANNKYCDIGAFEYSASSKIVVNTTNDQATGTCASTTGGCSLRDAIAVAVSGDTITFASGLAGTIQLTLGELVAHMSTGDSLTIIGPTTGSGITLDGGGNSRILYVDSPQYNTYLKLENLTFQNGDARNNASVSDGSGQGGAIYTYAIQLTVLNSTFYSNKGYGAGAIYFAYDFWSGLQVGNSTFFENTGYYTANESIAGAIYAADGGKIVDSTFDLNGAYDQYGGLTSQTTLVNGALYDTIIGGYVAAAPLCVGTSDQGGNLQYGASGTQSIPIDTSCTTNLTGPVYQEVDPFNDSGPNPLRNNGGPTLTLPIIANGPAASSGSLSACQAAGVLPNCSLDQRGFPRSSSHYSTGAFAISFMGPHIDTVGLYRQSSATFYLATTNNPTNLQVQTVSAGFGAGMTTPLAVVGDWDGSGLDGVGLYDQHTGQWRLCNGDSGHTCPTAADFTVTFGGGSSDVPLAGNWAAADTHYGVGVYRPSNGFLLTGALTTGYAQYSMVLGIPGDVGLVGDWNADGVDSPGVYRPSTGYFYLSDSVVSNGTIKANYAFQYGAANGGYSVLAGDWSYAAQMTDGVGLYQGSSTTFFLKNALTTGYADIQFRLGVALDQPIAGHWSGDAPPVAPRLVLPPNVLVPSTATPVSPGSGGKSGLGD